MLTFSTQNTLSLEPKSPPGVFACSTIYFLLTSPLLQVYARTKQHLLCKTKPISEALIMNLTSALTSTYEEKPPLEAPKNKANQTQFQTRPLSRILPAGRFACGNAGDIGPKSTKCASAQRQKTQILKNYYSFLYKRLAKPSGPPQTPDKKTLHTCQTRSKLLPLHLL